MFGLSVLLGPCHCHLIQHVARIVDTNGGIILHRGVVTTTIDVSDTTAQNLQIGLTQFWLGETGGIGSNGGTTCLIVALRQVYLMAITLIPIEIVTITTTEERTDDDSLVFYRLTFHHF